MLTAKVRSMALRLDAVQVATERLNRASLSRAGAFVRTRARSLLRRRKKPSPAGSPPSVHSKSEFANLRNIAFAAETPGRLLVVGPLLANQVNDLAGGDRTTVPEIHEFGQSVAIQEVSYDNGKTWRRRDRRRNMKAHFRYRTRTANYPPRPFMQPALEAEKPNFPDLFANALR